MTLNDKTVKCEVVVLGGGHTGLYTAERLAKHGFDVTLLEKKKAIGERVICTGIISEEAFDRFNLPEETVQDVIQHIRFYSPAGNHFDYDPPKPLARIVNRAQFNRYYENEALRAGVQIRTGQSIQKIRIKKDSVSVRSTSRNGEQTTYESKILILATGVNTQLFHSVGIRPPENFLSGAQIHIPYSGEARTLIYTGTKTAPGAFGWLVPLPATGVARVGILSEHNPGQYLRKLLDQIKPGWRDDVPESKIDLRPVIQGPLNKSYADRVLVVGEAAGQIKTTTGGGIYYGLLGAEIAVDVVLKAFERNRFKSDVLSTYDNRWKKIMAEELRVGYYFRKLYAKLTDEQVEELFDKVVQREVLGLAYKAAEFDWHRGLMSSVAKLPALRRMFQNPF